MDLTAGMDEAGRGPAIGPIVFGIVLVSPDQEIELKEAGVDDSKKLSFEKRKELESLISDISEVSATYAVEAIKIDSERELKTMNEIEVDGFRHLLNPYAARVGTLQLDAADVNAKRFGRNFTDLINGKIDSRHKGDSLFVSVAAASIIAKVKRDELVFNYQKEIDAIDPDLPSFGAGYPKQAKPFLREYVKKYNKLPYFARKSWKTCSTILDKHNHKQTSLSDWY